jgi:transcriptional regulator with XRE-family HTH domain
MGGTGHCKPSANLVARLGRNVRLHRQWLGLTQAELAERCGMPPSYVGAVEQGTVNITLANLERLAVGLNCWEADLLWKHLHPLRPYHYPFARANSPKPTLSPYVHFH